jgi:transposase InsO family protein
MVDYAQSNFNVSERKACQVLSIHRSSYRYRVVKRQALPAYQKVIALSHQYDYWGYRKITDLARLEQIEVGRERVREIRKAEGLQMPARQVKRRRRGMSNHDVSTAGYPGHVWSYDFIFDRTADGKTLKFLTLVDEYSRVSLVLPCGRSMTGRDVIRALQDTIKIWGMPTCIRSDNGAEFVAHQVKKWLDDHQIGTHYIDPGSPWQNPFVESFNSIFRTTFLNRWCFLTLAETKFLTQQWVEEYNLIRPHGSLAGLSPLQFLRNFHRDNPKFNHMTLPENLTLEVDQ